MNLNLFVLSFIFDPDTNAVSDEYFSSYNYCAVISTLCYPKRVALEIAALILGKRGDEISLCFHNPDTNN